MIPLSEFFYIAIISASILLSILGLWLTAVMPALGRWNRNFFFVYFTSFMLCCVTGLSEILLFYYPVPIELIYIVLSLESSLLSFPIVLITVFLVHSSKEDVKKSRLFQIIQVFWVIFIVLCFASRPLNIMTDITRDSPVYRGPNYPVLIMPLIAILLMNLTGTVKRRPMLTRKTYISIIVATLPLLVTVSIQMFIDVFPLIDISIVISAITMYAFILSDQLDQYMQQQQEIANQRANVMVLQMRPHFIYNTLMSIYSLCNQDPQKARRLTMDFTNYLRKNFNAVVSNSAIPFTAELEHTRTYLAVEQAQYEDLLFVDFDTPHTSFRLPPLTLQPIAENAVKHCIDPYSGPLHVSIKTRHTDVGSVITIEDNGPGFDPNDRSTPHPTLDNITERLDLMCKGKMEITPREGGGTKVTITIQDRITEE